MQHFTPTFSPTRVFLLILFSLFLLPTHALTFLNLSTQITKPQNLTNCGFTLGFWKNATNYWNLEIRSASNSVLYTFLANRDGCPHADHNRLALQGDKNLVWYSDNPEKPCYAYPNSLTQSAKLDKDGVFRLYDSSNGAGAPLWASENQASDCDECKYNLHTCDSHADCTNTNSSFTCACQAGYTGNGFSCTEINACVSNVCAYLGATCQDLPPPAPDLPEGRTCICPAGYTGSGDLCTDINACYTAPCGPNAMCQDLPTPAGDTSAGRICRCNLGYTGNGETCTNVDACVNNPCGNGNATCVDQAPPAPDSVQGRTCTCNAGYEGTGDNCVHVDTCRFFPCHTDATCVTNFASAINGTAGRTCTCNAGFSGDGTTCDDIDACIDFPCGSDSATCDDIHAPAPNSTLGRTCTCNTGYYGNGEECIDINACIAFPCSPFATCTDKPAPALNDSNGRECVCWPGYNGDGITCIADPCFNTPCSNDALCNAPSPPDYTCTCPELMTGTNCDVLQCQIITNTLMTGSAGITVVSETQWIDDSTTKMFRTILLDNANGGQVVNFLIHLPELPGTNTPMFTSSDLQVVYGSTVSPDGYCAETKDDGDIDVSSWYSCAGVNLVRLGSTSYPGHGPAGEYRLECTLSPGAGTGLRFAVLSSKFVAKTHCKLGEDLLVYPSISIQNETLDYHPVKAVAPQSNGEIVSLLSGLTSGETISFSGVFGPASPRWRVWYGPGTISWTNNVTNALLTTPSAATCGQSPGSNISTAEYYVWGSTRTQTPLVSSNGVSAPVNLHPDWRRCDVSTSLSGQSTVVCRTQALSAEVDYASSNGALDAYNRSIGLRFAVEIDGSWAVGNDLYSYPKTPVVNSVSGCANGNSGCPTNGTVLTLTGSFLEALGSEWSTPGQLPGELSVEVGDVNCPLLSPLSAPLSAFPAVISSVTCLLSEGVGTGLPVRACRMINQQKVCSSSMNSSLTVSYNKPHVSGLSGCGSSGSVTALSGCARAGGNIITLLGDNFGPEGATVLVGGVLCDGTSHVGGSPHSQLTCTLPAVLDFSCDSNLPVQVVQLGGTSEVMNSTTSWDGPTISFETCPPGSPPSNTTGLCEMCLAGSYSDGKKPCTQCVAGTYSAQNASQCTACPPGEFNNVNGSIGCTPCAQGSFAKFWGSTACDTCAVGQYTLSQGSSVCLVCAAGSFSASVQSCNMCTSGSFSPHQASSTCQSCDNGKYANTSGLTRCELCGPGYYSDTPSAACTKCPKGYANPYTGSSSCLGCAAGSFADEDGATECKLCDAGKYSLGNATGCLDCDAGKYSANKGSPTCFPCALGYFNMDANSTSCHPCPTGSAALNTTHCQICPEGYYTNSLGASSCFKCLPGQYSQANSSTCLVCGPGSYSLNDTTQCTNCSAGLYSATQGASGCIECSLGSINSAPNSRNCTRCNPGFFSNVSAGTQCYACPGGYYANSAGASGCLECPFGTFASGDHSTTCTACNPGFFSNVSAATQCEPCPAGSYASSSGASSCLPCAPGSSSAQNASTCEICPRGSYAPSGADQCLLCPKGTASNSTGQFACTPCAPGSYANATGSTSCTLCSNGTYQSNFNAESCLLCASSFAPGLSLCPTCPSSYVVSEDGSCKPCPAGTFFNATTITCDSCPRGTFSPVEGLVKCLKCPQGFLNNAIKLTACVPCPDGAISVNGTSCICRKNYYALRLRTDMPLEYGNMYCSPCPQGGNCSTVGTTYRTITPATGYAKVSSGEEAQFAVCLSAGCGATTTQTGTVTFTCAKGYQGLTCKDCIAGYTTTRGLDATSQCVPCPEHAESAGIMIGAAVLFVLTWWILVVTRGELFPRLLITGIQMFGIASLYGLAWPGTLGSILSALRYLTTWLDTVSLQCLLPLYGNKYVAAFYKRSLLVLLLPIFGLILVWMFAGLCGLLRKLTKSDESQPGAEMGLWKRLLRWEYWIGDAMVTLAWLLYLPIASQAFGFFWCTKIGSKEYLTLDLSVECWTPTHKSWTAGVGLFLLAYVLIIPGLFISMLRKQIPITSDQIYKPSWLFFTAGYRASAGSWFEFVWMYIKALLILNGLALARQPTIALILASAFLVLVYFVIFSRSPLHPRAFLMHTHIHRFTIALALLMMLIFFSGQLFVDLQINKTDYALLWAVVSLFIILFLVFVGIFYGYYKYKQWMGYEKHPVETMKTTIDAVEEQLMAEKRKSKRVSKLPRESKLSQLSSPSQVSSGPISPSAVRPSNIGYNSPRSAIAEESSRNDDGSVPYLEPGAQESVPDGEEKGEAVEMQRLNASADAAAGGGEEEPDPDEPIY